MPLSICFHVSQFVHDISFSSFFAFLDDDDDDDDDDNEDDYDNYIMIPRTGTVSYTHLTLPTKLEV